MYIFRRIFMLWVKPGSDHDVVWLDHGKNMYAKFELIAVYRDLAQTKWQPLPSRPGGVKTKHFLKFHMPPTILVLDLIAYV